MILKKRNKAQFRTARNRNTLPKSAPRNISSVKLEKRSVSMEISRAKSVGIAAQEEWNWRALELKTHNANLAQRPNLAEKVSQASQRWSMGAFNTGAIYGLRSLHGLCPR